MRIVLVIVSIFSSLVACPYAFAAMVNATVGQVLVNRGQGYKQVIGSSEAAAGDIVVANPGGSGQVVYSDGCTVTVNPGSVYTIALHSPCSKDGDTGSSGMSTTTMLVVGGAVVVGGGGAAAYFLLSKPSSP